MSKSGVDWCDYSWSPMSGCTPVSPACDHCYARSMATRFAGGKQFPNGFKVTLHPERLEQPFHWQTPRRVFVCPTGDLFHEEVPDEFIRKVFLVMENARRHTFQVLTKRPERMLAFIRDWFARTSPDGTERCSVPDNIWLGVTAENQEMADKRIPILLQVPAAIHWVSYEPGLGPLELDPHWVGWVDIGYDHAQGKTLLAHWSRMRGFVEKPATLDWVIVGGETGPGARPMHPDWVRSVRDQARAAGVPFFLKSWGEWASTPGDSPFGSQYRFADGSWVYRVGKHAAGHLLDGQEWRQFPETVS